MIKKLLCEDTKCIIGGFHLGISNELMISKEEKLYLDKNTKKVKELAKQGCSELEAKIKILSDMGFSYDSPREVSFGYERLFKTIK